MQFPTAGVRRRSCRRSCALCETFSAVSQRHVRHQDAEGGEGSIGAWSSCSFARRLRIVPQVGVPRQGLRTCEQQARGGTRREGSTLNGRKLPPRRSQEGGPRTLGSRRTGTGLRERTPWGIERHWCGLPAPDKGNGNPQNHSDPDSCEDDGAHLDKTCVR